MLMNNELEDMAIEAANCPREHIIKSFMLQAVSSNVRGKIQPHIFLPMKEFKFKLKMLIQEEGNRFQNSQNHQHFRNSQTQHTPTHHSSFRNASQNSHRSINAMNQVNDYGQENEETTSFRSPGNANA